ncbi:ABC transporter substrate-binding protein [Pedobacter sp. SD-b]|uniref:ABC transporter substrate-binding protein n=1 Tax=Pedobacter segetis TaxID=2793069 RepID=A0ABS1BM34_9SPHI|nr:ABC transporter substrate-binding protein [Pedobacter segetis]MBK0383847.1 ABC transporter substrate-binding protein [Pedobacter segetis]
MLKLKTILSGIVILSVFACNNDRKTANGSKDENNDPMMKQSWEQIEQKAKGSTVTWMKWTGDKKANKYIDDILIPRIKNRFGITLKIIPGQGPSIVSSIMSEREANVEKGQTDMVWINGETFFQIQQIKGLYGPFTYKLPSSQYINYEDPIIKYDFQQDIKGYEAPWGKASFIALTDGAKVKNPPVSMQDFETYWKANPGKFTLSLDFTGYTLLKTWLIELAGGIDNLKGDFDQKKYDKYSAQLWDFINRNKKYFWKKGETFPDNAVTIAQLYATGEVNFGFSFGFTAVDKGIKEGLFPKTTIGYVLKPGSIHNTSYLAIPFNASNKEGALVVINYLLSPEAQIEKSDINNGGGTPVFDVSKLSPELKAKYDALEKPKYGMTEEEVLAKAIVEPHSMYMIKVAEDFRKKVIDKK